MNKKDIISPLLTRSTHIDNEIRPSNDNQSVLSVKNCQMNKTHVISFDENILKSIIISFDRTTYIKYYQKWKKKYFHIVNQHQINKFFLIFQAFLHKK